MHALSFKIAGLALASGQQKVTPELVTLVELSDRKSIAEAVASRYGFQKLVLDDWHSVVQQPDIDIFINAGPNDAHGDPSILAAQSGKHIFSEKPLASTADEALAIWRAVEVAGVWHQCGFIHRFIPSLRLARDMIRAGELGEILHFRSQFLLDMQEPDRSLTWRFSTAAAGGGSTGDLGSHHIDAARFLVGEVAEICASTRTWSKDSTRRILDVNDDSFSAVARLEPGTLATFEASRITPGHGLTGRIEIDGTKGSLAFSMERLNELVFTEPRRGPRTIFVTGPAHPYADFFLPVGIQGAHAISWRDCFVFQAHHMLEAVERNEPVGPNAATFEDGYRVAEIVDTILRSVGSRSFEPVRFRV